MKKLLLAAYFFLSIISGQSQVIFSINDREVTKDEFKYVYSKNSFNNQNAFTKKDMSEYLELYINFKLKVHEASQLGYDTLSTLVSEFNTYREQLKKPYLSDETVLNQQVQEAYDRLKEEVHASHILIRCKPDDSPADTLAAWNKIIKLKQAYVAGEPFEKLAVQYSEDPSARSNQGNLGYFTSMQMVYPFESAAFKTDPGEVSDPVRTQFGYHLIKVHDRRASVGKVKVSHIMVRFRRNMNQNDSLIAEKRINEIYVKLRKGESWDQLCAMYSEDPSSKSNNGLLRPFGLGVMPLPFQEMAFSLKKIGDISIPFMTDFGWHIIRMEEIIGLEPLKQLEPTIKARINSDGRAQLQRKVMINRLKSENGFLEIKENLEVFKQEGAKADQTLALIKINDREFTIADFLKNHNSYSSEEYEKFEADCVIEYEESILEQKYPQYGFLLNEYREGIQLFKIMDEKVWSKASEDSIGLYNFYKDNLEKYKVGARVVGLLFQSQEKSVIDSVENFIASHPNVPSDSVKYYFNNETDLVLKISEGKFDMDNPEMPEHLELKAGITRYSKDEVFSLLLSKEIIPEGFKEFSEVKGVVISDYQELLDQIWIEELKSKYRIDRNKKNIRHVFKELAK